MFHVIIHLNALNKTQTIALLLMSLSIPTKEGSIILDNRVDPSFVGMTK
jgi:hypothetical protein